MIDGADITTVIKDNENDTATFAVSLKIKKDPREVFDYYAEVLKDAKDLYKMESTDVYSVAGSKENCDFNIMIQPGTEKGITEFSIGIDRYLN